MNIPLQPTLSHIPLESSWILCKGGDSSPPPKGPKTAVYYSDLATLQAVVPSSGHTISKMTLHQNKSFHTVYFKKCDSTYPPLLAQIEAAASASYRLVRGKNAALVRPVVNHSGQVVGSVSFEVPNFASANEHNLKLQDLIDGNVAEALVARYARQEDDYHPWNMGVVIEELSNEILIIDIDFDMTFYPYTSKIKGPRLINNGVLGPLPEKAFPITQRDLKKHPDIKDQQPCYWPTKFPNNSNWRKAWNQRDLFLKLADNPKYEEQKWNAFLREVCIPHSMHHRAVLDNFVLDAEGRGKAEELISHIQKRYEVLENSLIQLPEFRHFLISQPGILHKIEKSFSENIENYADHEKSVKQKFYSLVKKCMVKDMTACLFQVGLYLHSNNIKNGLNWEVYNWLISLIQNFHEDLNDFETGFSLLEPRARVILNRFFTGVGSQWARLGEQLTGIVTNYSRFCGKVSQELLSVSLSQSKSIHSGSAVLLNKQIFPKVIAEEVFAWVEETENTPKIIQIVEECIAEYAPSYEKINPWSFFRTRRNDLEKVLTQLKAQYEMGVSVAQAVISFFKNGAWNPAGRLTGPSANVLLISKLASAALQDFQTMLSPSLLKNHELVKVCFLIQNHGWNLEEHAEAIAGEMDKMMKNGKRPNEIHIFP